MDRYYLTRSTTNTREYALEVHEVVEHDASLIPTLIDLDLLSFFEPTFSRFTLGAILRFGRVFTITADGLVIGACHCLRAFSDPEEVVVFNMALRPGWRGHGLGTRLLHGVLSLLQAQGTKTVSLLVQSTNERAIGVYRHKFGFQLVGERNNEYGNGHVYLHMRLDLSQPLPPSPPVGQPEPLAGPAPTNPRHHG